MPSSLVVQLKLVCLPVQVNNLRMPTLMRSEMSTTASGVTIMKDDPRKRGIQAFGLAIVIEMLLLVGGAAIFSGVAQPQPALSEPVPITLTADVPLKEKPLAPKPTLPPPPQPKVKQVVKRVVKQVPPVPTPPTPPTQQSEPAPTPVAPAAQTVSTQPAPKAPTPPPEVPQSSKGDPNAGYAAKVKAAVEAVHSYPAAAAAMHFSGQARIWISIKDGEFIDVKLLRGCGVGIFDRVALDEARSAHYPAPPAELHGQLLNYEVNISLTTN